MNKVESCLIWGTKACTEDKTGDYDIVNSPRAGGWYQISGRAAQILESCDEHVKARLTSWLIDQRRFGEQSPKVDTDKIEEAKGRRELPVRERADRLLEYFRQLESHVGCRFVFPQWEDNESGFLNMLAWSESTVKPGNIMDPKKEIEFFVDYHQTQGWISVSERKTLDQNKSISLTVDGYTHLDELEHVGTDSSQAFVAMWFDDSMKAMREEGMKTAIRNAGYKPMVINQKEHIGKIDDEIIAEIRRSRFIVADFTHGCDGARGSVYYEAGFARGLNIPVIFTCRKDALKKIHFDTRQYTHIDWETPEELREKLAKRIGAEIGDGPFKNSDEQ